MKNYGLHEVPPPLLALKGAVSVLDLRSNRLRTLPPALGALTNLTILRLYGNRLVALPAALGKLSALEELDVGKNNFVSLAHADAEDAPDASTQFPLQICAIKSLKELVLKQAQKKIMHEFN